VKTLGSLSASRHSCWRLSTAKFTGTKTQYALPIARWRRSGALSPGPSGLDRLTIGSERGRIAIAILLWLFPLFDGELDYTREARRCNVGKAPALLICDENRATTNRCPSHIPAPR
jgi:hypothetical protein